MSIDKLPDDILLEIFDFHVNEDRLIEEGMETWQTLVHVCRQWRTIVFRSPRRLDLRLSCPTKTKTPVRDTLDIWPPVPLVVYGDVDGPEELDNSIAVLECSDRVHHINIDISSSYFEDVFAAMQKSFPELKLLWLHAHKVESVIPDSFLGGTAPRLQTLLLDGIPFPGLPKLLLSATHLLNLDLSNIPHSGYFSPEAIVAALSTLSNLQSFYLGFRSPQSLPSRRPPPPTRPIFPILLSLRFKGVSEYLEDLVAQIDAPRLDFLHITFFNQIEFDAPQTLQFINRTPRLKALGKARLIFQDDTAVIGLSSQSPGYGSGIEVQISCKESDWQVSSMEQVCTSCLPSHSALEDLYIYENLQLQPIWKDNIDNMLWLELLHPFFSVKNLYLSEKIVLRIGPALLELVGDRTTEVLPTLQNIFLEGLKPSGPDQEGIVKFVAARKHLDHPVAVSLWERDY